MGNWESSVDAYKSIFLEMEYSTPPQQRQVIMRLSRCYNEMGKYDEAFDFGNGALEMNLECTNMLHSARETVTLLLPRKQ